MNDPYTSTEACIARLLSEYRTHHKLILAVDFDDTVFDYHVASHTYERALRLIRSAKALGFYVMLFTGATPEKWKEQTEFLAERDIYVDTINHNPISLPFGNHGKPYYNLLLDDRAGLGQALNILERVLEKIIAGDADANLS